MGRTELRIPSSGFAGDGGLPGLQHIHESADSMATRGRAGQLGPAVTAGTRATGYTLNLRITAPNQVFIRGRGLDAELGGALTLQGSTAAIVPSGAFNLIRGRLDILGRRLQVSEALLQLQGALVPFLRIVASTESDGITASVQIEGSATDPLVSFTSDPDLPQEEVLARLLFDRGLESLTAFQAVQLAGAVATLAGRAGVGVIDNLRQRAGLDNLDLTANGVGSAELTFGKYLSEKAYTEVTLDQGGKSSISINLDLAPHVTVKGQLDSDGQTGIGLFLQRNY
jgi:translocation and assembly module TamB